MGLFSENAPNYWNAGLPVIPLRKWNFQGKGAGKAPILNEWTGYASTMVTQAMQGHWSESYPDANIGLPFGQASGLCAIDIDTEDENLIKAILEALPRSPWKRVGKKGMGLIYKWSGQHNFKLRDGDNQSIVEFLGKGNQMVMPPSIHPDTHKPYVSDTNLWEVLDQILPLPHDLESRLRDSLSGVLGGRGITLAQTAMSGPLDVVPSGERDIQMVRRAGYYARVVLGIDKNSKFGLAEAMRHMYAWVIDQTSHNGSDDMDPDKGVAKLLEFLLKDVESGKTLPNGWDVGLTDAQKVHPAIAEMLKLNEVQRWTGDRARQWIKATMEKSPDDLDYATEKVSELIANLAKDEHFTEFHFKIIADDLQKAFGSNKVSKPALLAQFKDHRKSEVEQAADQEAIARQVIEALTREGEIRYFQEKFWQWNGSCFQKTDDDDISNYIAENIKGNVLSRRQNDYKAITKLVASLVRGPLIRQLEIGINFANGFLDSELKLHEHSPKYGKTFTMPFDYVAERAGEAHKWFEFLEQCWGDDEDYAEKVLALQEAFAATMFGIAPNYQRAFLLHGKPSTGKSTMLEILRTLMPADSQCAIPPNQWGERFQLTDMVGKTLNICSELPEESGIRGDTFKMVIPGESIQTEFKGKDPFQFRPTCAHWFSSNFLPRSRDTSGGFSRRWLIWEFANVLAAHLRVPNFHQILISEEREAIAAWAVQGLHRLQKQKGYTLSASHKKKLSQVITSNNSVAAFLEQATRCRATGLKEDISDLRSLFDQYVVYMKEVARGWTVSYERFKSMIEDLEFTVTDHIDHDGVKRFQVEGVRILTPVLPK